MNIVETTEESYVHFTYDEEIDFARSIFDALNLVWITDEAVEEFQRIYYRKSEGLDITVESFDYYVRCMIDIPYNCLTIG